MSSSNQICSNRKKFRSWIHYQFKTKCLVNFIVTICVLHVVSQKNILQVEGIPCLPGISSAESTKATVGLWYATLLSCKCSIQSFSNSFEGANEKFWTCNIAKLWSTIKIRYKCLFVASIFWITGEILQCFFTTLLTMSPACLILITWLL